LASGDRSEFLAALANFAGFEVGHFGRKWPGTNSRRVGLRDTKDLLNFRWRDTYAGGGAAGNGAGGRDVGIGAVIDASMVPCAPSKRTDLAFVESAVDKLGGVADVGANFFAEAQGFLDFMGKIDVRAVGSFCEAVFSSTTRAAFSRNDAGSSRSQTRKPRRAILSS